MKTVVFALLGILLITGKSFAATPDDACLHTIVRDALNHGKTMHNLGPWLNESYDFSRQNQPATPLPAMRNSGALRASAATVAASCNFAHSGWPEVGENLFVGTERPGKTYEEWQVERNWTTQNAVNDWAYEARLLTIQRSTTSCIGGSSKCGHYTQMMWDDTTEVGCASQFCPNGISNFSGRESTMVVCHYSPQGNYVGQIGGPYLPPYQVGGQAQSAEPALEECSSKVYPYHAIQYLLW